MSSCSCSLMLTDMPTHSPLQPQSQPEDRASLGSLPSFPVPSWGPLIAPLFLSWGTGLEMVYWALAPLPGTALPQPSS